MMILAVMMVMTISATAMSYNAAKHEALFLSDKMAYELNLTAAQYEAVYEINLDYLMSLNGHGDVFGIWWDRRNADLRFVLTPWQYDKYVALLSPRGLEGWRMDIRSIHSLQQRAFLQCTSKGVRDLQGWPQQDSRLTLCSHAQAHSTSPRSSCAPSCTCSASPKDSCES